MSIAGTDECLYFITERGEVLVTGSLSAKQIAASSSVDKKYKHMHLYTCDKNNNVLPKFVFVTAGHRHAFLIDENNELWTVGIIRRQCGGFECDSKFVTFNPYNNVDNCIAVLVFFLDLDITYRVLIINYYYH